jgi:predicted nucleotidyltransferase
MVSSQMEKALQGVLDSTDKRVLAAYLFGSMAQGTESADSDVNIGILFRSRPVQTLDSLRFSLEGDLECGVGRRVQLLVLNDAPPDLIHRVVRDGRLLLDRDPAARIRFEVDSRNRYFDLLPILERYRKPKAVTP